MAAGATGLLLPGVDASPGFGISGGTSLAATMVTVALALPMLLVVATIELTLWPRLLELASPNR